MTTQQDIGESSSGRMAVSKTAHGGSNPSSPVLEGIYFRYVPFFYLIRRREIMKEHIGKIVNVLITKAKTFTIEGEEVE